MYVEVHDQKGVCVWGTKLDIIPRIGERIHQWVDVWKKFRHFTITDVRWCWGKHDKVILVVKENDSY